MKRRAAVGLGLLVAAAPAFGCGHCAEDKVAAVYDHRVITTAHARGQQVAFFAIEGPLQAGAESRRVIARALRPVDGVDSRSLRVATDAGSLSLSYDGKLTSSSRIVDALNRALAPRGVSVFLLKATA